MSLKQPDWNHWSKVDLVELWVAVALALDLDPEDPQVAQARDGTPPLASSEHSDLVLLQRFQRRLREADLLTWNDIGPVRDNDDKPTTIRVHAIDFAGRVLRWRWNLPDRFPQPRSNPIDWDLWRDILQAELWRVVAASVGISPDFLMDNETFSLGLARKLRLPNEFLKRYRIAEARLDHEDDGLPTVDGPWVDQNGEPQVRFSDFARLAKTKHRNWTLPDAFPPPATESEQPRPGDKWPWGAYETKLLGHLAAAVEEFWMKYDHTKPTTAPRNKTVVAWLTERGVKPRTAEEMAKIIHPD